MVTAEAARTPAKGIETREPDVEKVPSFRALGLHAGARHRLAVSNMIIYFIIVNFMIIYSELKKETKLQTLREIRECFLHT